MPLRLLFLCWLSVTTAGGGVLTPTKATQPVTGDADDPALWVHPTNPELSLIIGTDKVSAKEGGGLYVFGLDGELKQPPLFLENPNNVDVEQNVRTPDGRLYDLAVATERGRRRLAIFSIDRTSGRLRDVSGQTLVFRGEKGESGAPMGVALYKRPKDGALFAIVSRKEGPTKGYLHQYRLVSAGPNRFDARFVRKFGLCRSGGEIEALLVDDEMGFVYGAEELVGIRKYAADPDAPNANRELACFGKTGYQEDREGLGLYRTGKGTGYIFCSDQRDNSSLLRVYPRSGTAHPELGAIPTSADATDGIEVSSSNLGSEFERGAVVMMDSKRKRFVLFPWDDVRDAARLR